MYQDIINKVVKYNETSASQIQEIFESAGIKSLKRDDSIYKIAGLNPRGLSTSMIQLLSVTANKTQNNLSNLTMTTASTSQNQFLEAMNKSYMEVSTGVKSYSQSILDTIKDISSQGAYIEYPSGQHRSLESAVRMNVLTSVNQTTGRLQLMRADEMNWDLMEISAHSGARPEHAEWQGKVVSRSGKEGYLSLADIGYGDVTGFQGVNCRHTWFPYYESSTLTYTDEELEELKNETITYNGQKINKYDASQKQRRMERQIRQDKKDIAGLQGILTSNNKDEELVKATRDKLLDIKNKLNQDNMILNDFVLQTGFKKDYTRLNVNNVLINKEINDTISQINFKEVNKLNYIDITENILKDSKKRYKLVKQKYYIDEKGEKYIVDGKHVILKTTEREREVANILGKIYGGKVRIIPRVNEPEKIKTPDYMIRNEKFDLKEIRGNGKNTLDNAIKKQEKQATNFIFDISKSKMNEKDAIEQINNIYNSKHREWVEQIILIKDDNILKIYQRK